MMAAFKAFFIFMLIGLCTIFTTIAAAPYGSLACFLLAVVAFGLHAKWFEER